MKEGKTKKKLRWWFYPLAVLVLLVLAVALIGSRNGKAMNNAVDAGLETLSRYYTVTEADAGEFSELKIYGLMKFRTRRYEVAGLGNLCTMTMNMGIMQMSTFVLTPYEKNMPMLSMDFMYILGNRKSYVEVYDLVADTQDEAYQAVLSSLERALSAYSDLEDIEPSSGWYDHLLTVDAYKAGKSAQDARIHSLFVDSVEAYAAASEPLPALADDARSEKLAITQTYCDTMVEKGGVSTSIFKKALGDDVTSRFFNTVFFGPANY